MVDAFDWGRIFQGDEYTWMFLLEVVLRSGIMFIMMVLFFRLCGKTEIKQLNIYDVIIIVGLGSAAGDPMLYDDVPLLNGIVVFVTVLGLYRLITYISGKNKKLDRLLEGKVRCIISETNCINMEAFQKEKLQINDLLTSLRLQKISQLGQVEKIYIETSGEFSIFFHKDENVKAGLPIYPEELEKAVTDIDIAGEYSCTNCGCTQKFEQPVANPICPNCEKVCWIKSADRKRVT